MTKKIKIVLNPIEANWVMGHFMDTVVIPLKEAGVLKFHEASMVHRTAGISIFQNNKWERQAYNQTGLSMLAKFAQDLNFPVIVENENIYYIIDETDAVIEYLKYKF
jgi:hypothetical protein